MSGFDIFDPMAMELDAMFREAEAEEQRHDCEGCTERMGIPCVIAKSCTRVKEEQA